MLVEDIMSRDLVTIDEGATLADAVGRMLDHDVGSVIVISGGDPVGFLTRENVLDAAHRQSAPLAAIPVAAVDAGLVPKIDPGVTVRRAATRMFEADSKKLAVVDGLDLVGVITLTDIVWHVSDLLKEAADHGRPRDGWSPE